MSEHDSCDSIDVGRCCAREFATLPFAFLIQHVLRHIGFVT